MKVTFSLHCLTTRNVPSLSSVGTQKPNSFHIALLFFKYLLFLVLLVNELGDNTDLYTPISRRAKLIPSLVRSARESGVFSSSWKCGRDYFSMLC